MIFWILVAGAGGIVSLVGLAGLVGQYRRREISRRYLAAVSVAYVTLVAFAVFSAARPDLARGPIVVAMLLPASIAVVVLTLEARKNSEVGGPRD